MKNVQEELENKMDSSRDKELSNKIRETVGRLETSLRQAKADLGDKLNKTDNKDILEQLDEATGKLENSLRQIKHKYRKISPEQQKKMMFSVAVFLAMIVAGLAFKKMLNDKYCR